MGGDVVQRVLRPSRGERRVGLEPDLSFASEQMVPHNFDGACMLSFLTADMTCVQRDWVGKLADGKGGQGARNVSVDSGGGG